MSEITNFKLCDLVDKIKKKELSSKEITEAFINCGRVPMTVVIFIKYYLQSYYLK